MTDLTSDRAPAAVRAACGALPARGFARGRGAGIPAETV